MKRLKFRKGERVKVRQDLMVGFHYSMSNDEEQFSRFNDDMRKNLGEEATVMEVSEKGYKLDIDSINIYTDGMLKKFVDAKARDNKIAERDADEVEGFINHILRLLPEQQINHALDTGNKELFDKLTREYPKTKG